MSKLSENDIYRIIEIAKSREYTYTELGEIFNIHPETIHSILTRKSWKHLEISEEDQYNIKMNNIPNRGFSNLDIHNICKFFESVDINNKNIYKSMNDILKDCFYSLKFDEKYDFNSKRKTLARILLKLRHTEISNEYNYNFIK